MAKSERQYSKFSFVSGLIMLFCTGIFIIAARNKWQTPNKEAEEAIKKAQKRYKKRHSSET